MTYKFKIINIDEQNAVMQVNYFCDELPDGVILGVNILPNASKEKIIEHIKQHVPYNTLEREILLKDGLEISHIQDLVNIEHEIEPPTKIMSEEDTLKMIEELLKKSE